MRSEGKPNRPFSPSAIGVETVNGAHAAGLAGIGVEAGRTFILDLARTLARADELGLFIVGIEPREGG